MRCLPSFPVFPCLLQSCPEKCFINNCIFFSAEKAHPDFGIAVDKSNAHRISVKSCTSTRSPFSNVPMTLSISLSKIHMPPDFTILPSPFFNVTTALMLVLLRNLFLIIYHKYTNAYQYQGNHTFDACCLLFFSQKPCGKNHTKHRVHKSKYRYTGNRIIF